MGTNSKHPLKISNCPKSFYTSVREQDGTFYKTASLKSILAATDLFLRSPPLCKQFNIYVETFQFWLLQTECRLLLTSMKLFIVLCLFLEWNLPFSFGRCQTKQKLARSKANPQLCVRFYVNNDSIQTLAPRLNYHVLYNSQKQMYLPYKLDHSKHYSGLFPIIHICT